MSAADGSDPKNRCPVCGEPVTGPASNFCNHCGAPLTPEASEKRAHEGMEQIRNPWVAALLSFFFCGWGQWYNGQTWDGVQFLAASLVALIAMYGSVFLGNYGGLAYLLAIVFVILFFVIWIYGMADAYRTAEKINGKKLPFTKKSRLFWVPVALIIIFFGILIIGTFASLAYISSG